MQDGHQLFTKAAMVVGASLAGSIATLSKQKQFIVGGIAGGLLGAAVALLFAPKSGSELMKDLSNTFSFKATRKKHERVVAEKSAPRKKRGRKKKVLHGISKVVTSLNEA